MDFGSNGYRTRPIRNGSVVIYQDGRQRSTRYWLCNQQTWLESSTFHDQQVWILLHNGQTTPNPCQQFLDDIILQIWHWHQQKKAVLIFLDANENVINPSPQGIGWILAKTNLADLHYHQYPNQPRPTTYNQGSSTIDTCLGSPEFINAMTAASILPFGMPIQLTSNHHALLLDFDSRILFGHKPPPSCLKIPLRGKQQCHINYY